MSRFSVTVGSTDVRFLVAGVPVFEVSTDFFDGEQRLYCVQRNGSVALDLKGGLLPGTNIPADFQLLAEHCGSGWLGKLAWPGLGFSADFPFEQWLLGRPVAQGSASISDLLSLVSHASLRNTHNLAATFFPNWALQADGHFGLESALGTLAVNNVQLNIVGPKQDPVALEKMARPRSHLWTRGSLTLQRTVRVDGAAVRFGSGRLDALVEMGRQADGRLCSAVSGESISDTGGYVSPIGIDQADAPLQAKRLRIAQPHTGRSVAEADFEIPSKWFSKGIVNVELTAASGKFRSSASEQERFVVTRIVVPFEGVDQAVFLRRDVRVAADGHIDATGVAWLEAIDDLKWFDGFHLGGRTVPLDEFELKLTRGADAFAASVRFNEVLLVAESGKCSLQAGRHQPILELALGSQHVYEEAIYVTEMPGAKNAQGGESEYISDEDICQLLNLGTGTTCETRMREIRQRCEYDKYRMHALAARALLPYAPLSKPLNKADARFAAPTWLTFNWNADEREFRRIELTAKDLFDLDRHTNKGKKRFNLRLHPMAVPTSLSIEKQLPLKSEKTRRPRSLSELSGNVDADYATVIQAPYRLGLSPIPENETAPIKLSWNVRGGADSRSPNLHELWTVRVENLPLRVIWSPDYDPGNFWAKGYLHAPHMPFRSSLDSRDRHELVALTSRFGEPALMGSAQVVPNPDPAQSCGGEQGILSHSQCAQRWFS